jgi:hypothetical protein
MWAKRPEPCASGLSKSLLETYIFEEAEKYHGPICDYIAKKYGDAVSDMIWEAAKAVGVVIKPCIRRNGNLVLFGKVHLTEHFMETMLYDDAYDYHEPVSNYIEANFSSLVEKYGDDKDLEWIAHEMVRDAYTKINASCACQGWPETTNK